MVWSLEYGRRVYDRWAAHPGAYDLLMWLVTFGREDELRRRTVDSLDLSEGDTVLDLACGAGANIPLLREAVGGEGSVVGVDYSPRMLRRARERAGRDGWRNVELVRADAASHFLRDATVDAAVCTMSLSAIPDHVSAVENARRTLKTGGRLAVMDSSDLEGPLRVLNPLLRRLFKYTTNWDYRKDVVGALRGVFDDVDVERYNDGSLFVAVATG